MIVIDTSAIYAILADEPEAPAIRQVLSGEVALCLSAPTLLEASIVCESKLATGRDRLDALMRRLEVECRAFDSRQADLASEAFRRFGRGSGHPARLNFGDCFSYALARTLDAPLLFKGDDFLHTDVRSAIAA